MSFYIDNVNDAEAFAQRLSDSLYRKFNTRFKTIKLLHMLSEMNGFRNWNAWRANLQDNMEILDEPKLHKIAMDYIQNPDVERRQLAKIGRLVQ